MSGVEAVAAAARNIDPSSRIVVSSGLGPIELQSGTVYARKQLLVTADTASVIYLENDQLYREPTASFVRNHYFDVLPDVAERTGWIVKLSKVEYAIISGLLVPLWAIAAVTAADVILTYKANPEPFDLLWTYGPCVKEELKWLKERHPEVYEPLAAAVLREVEQDLVEGIEAEDVAFFLARIVYIIRNVRRTVFRGLLLFLNAALLSLKTLARAAEGAARRGVEAMTTIAERDNAADRLVEELGKRGIQLTQEDARRVVTGLLRDPELRRRMDLLRSCLDGIVPALELITRRFLAVQGG
jgi:uncharacterized MAPEG superfamily protein